MKRVHLLKKPKQKKAGRVCSHCRGQVELLPGGTVYECMNLKCGQTIHKNEFKYELPRQ